MWYVPNNMTLMVIGDFSTSEMIELVKKKVWHISGRIDTGTQNCETESAGKITYHSGKWYG